MIDLEKGKTIYVSGPMSGYTNYNFEEFFYWGKLLKLHGYKVINPADKDLTKMFHGWQYTEDQWEDLIEYDRMLIKCYADAVFLLKGWEDSKGALLEIEEANLKQIPLFYEEKV